MSRLTLILISTIFITLSCENPGINNQEAEERGVDYASFVNPFVGTSRMGHTYPGATAPFGMVQLTPQTWFVEMYDENGNYNAETYEYCAGYQYRDSTILGFAHTSFSGTGHSDLGDILVMPVTGSPPLYPIESPGGEKGFLSSFSHEREEASPGYYKVDLLTYGIEAELTATERAGMHRYTFSNNDEAQVILDLVYNIYHHDNKNVWTSVRVENDSLITGYRQTQGWGRDRKVFFAIQFSRPFKSYGFKKFEKETYTGFYRRFNQEENFPEMAGRGIRAHFDYSVSEGEELLLKIGLSSVSSAGALANLEKEIPGWDFNGTMENTRRKWNRELAVIEAEMMNDEDMVTFYTAMYHAALSPILYEDVDGNYRGLDQNIHTSGKFTNYTIFSLWDTYRALHPLFNLIRPSRNNDMIKSMLAHQEQSVHGMLPVWSHYANENWCMIGYHSVSVIADAVAKGIGDFDRGQALRAAIETSKVPYFDGLGYYMEYGYVPDDLSHSGVSKTLELAYDDWCISTIAATLGESEIEAEYLTRSGNYRNNYDTESGFMRPKMANGEFRADFDPLDTHGQGFIEGNAWNYGLYVPQDIPAMIALMGGPQRLTTMLDSLFTMELDDKYIENTEDITRDGIIGNYVHGNEPGHHIPYLYNFTGSPHKTQERVRMIMESMYGPGVDGLCGNDDAGQMSAWYIFSALGFYPVTPGSPWYEVGSPLVRKAVINLENGKRLTISTENQAPGNIYVKSVTFNGIKVENSRLHHNDLAGGGELVFEMSSSPASS